MGANLQDVFLKAMAAVFLCFAALCIVKHFVKAVPRFWGTAFRTVLDWAIWACLQLLLNLAFLVSYVLYAKNGTDLSFSDLGVAFTVVSALVFCLAWRLGFLGQSAVVLLPALAYSVFLLHRFFAAGGGLGFFGYAIYNPMFAFIGSNLQGNSRTLAAVSALLPLACSALGRGLAVKSIDKN